MILEVKKLKNVALFFDINGTIVKRDSRVYTNKERFQINQVVQNKNIEQ
jgi:hypothetical protein